MSAAAPMTFDDVDCTFPPTLAEALHLLANQQTHGRLLAGGTDLMVQWESGARALPARVISIKHLPELKQIEETAGEVVIGAAVTHMDIRRSATVQAYLPSLVDAAATIGGFQIQTMGTIGGSVANASPAGDVAPSILITDGWVVVASVRGEREIPVTEFWTGYRQIDLQPDELIVRFRLPKTKTGEREIWRKLGPRQAQASSTVLGSARMAVQEGVVTLFRVAVGSVAPTCVRLPEVESWLVGKPIDGAVLTELEKRVAASVHPIADIRSTAAYRRWVTGRMVRGFVEQLGARG
jgi:CO/xanthine dehydrogenase FAD-binding subunit